MCADHSFPPSTSRRGFLFKLGLGLNALGALLVAIPRDRVHHGTRAPAGAARPGSSSAPSRGFPEGQTRLAIYENPFRVAWDGPTAKVACWVRRLKGDEFQVFAINCAHLGCPVRWFPQSRLFMCPCHGGAYYEDGSHASGPPPRGLYQYEYQVKDGQLLVRGGQLPTLSGPV